jgi:hypothetical protein
MFVVRPKEIRVICTTKVRNLVFSRGRLENPRAGTQTLNLCNLRIISSVLAASPRYEICG